MNVKRFLSDSFRRQIDNRINRLVVNHKINQTRDGARTQLLESKPLAPLAPVPSGSQISSEHASIIYYKKCEDLGLLPNPTAEKRFIEQFMNSINAKSLRFNGLGLGPKSIRCAVELFYSNPQVVYIDLSLNRLGDEGATVIGQYLLLNTPLVYIDLRSNGIGIQGCVSLFKGLKSNFHVTNLDLSAVDGIERNRIGTEGCKQLALVLECNETLSHLNAAMCGITADGCRFLGPALSNNRALVTLDLTANRFGSVGATNIFSNDDSFGCLTTLILARNGIGDDAAKPICRQLARSQTIAHLDLSDNSLGKRFLKHLYEALQFHQLTSLNLSKNKFGPECADYFHIIIRDFQSIKHLNISSNQFRDMAIMQIADALKQNNKIVSLDLSDTIICDDSAASLSVVLKTHPSLQRLSLATNRITDASGVLIAKALATNPSLVVLSLKNNELRDETALALLESLSKNTTISDLDISYNDFSYRSYVKLSQMIEEHKHTLNSNIAEVATKHIEWLKSEEQRLFKYREDIAEQTEIVENTTGQRNLKQEELRNLIARKTEETNTIQAELDEVKAQYDKVAEERRGQLQEYNDLKMAYDGKHTHAQTQFTSLASKRQLAETRVRKAEKQRKVQSEENAKLMQALKDQLNDAREQLKTAINDALAAKKMILDEEERQKEEARLAALAEKKAKKKGGKRGNSPGKTGGGKKKKGGKGKGKAKAKSPLDRPATAP
ncbi:hypothetical protein TRFO_28619 [Tritrichomonas foetus]|uniref:Leucine Rich Repeat family protein n=1 Tax=Tritrichomonas foetus TaxID=1144522 RepID=A0A1J4K390_9EUKA|nr:hypothetical protein TRFO_28619 [Tritrichomonas foetus]|eukprot:OHT03965.1 hypothetical protein TRFO_28619 [Tritrichomonas foetus]